jgi:hypothetical protein
VAIAAWLAGLFSLDAITSDGNLEGWLAAAWSILLGAVVGRWWILVVPWLAAAGLLTYTELAPACHCTSTEDEIPFIGLVLIGAAAAFLADMAIGIGLALRCVLSWATQGFSSASAQDKRSADPRPPQSHA